MLKTCYKCKKPMAVPNLKYYQQAEKLLCLKCTDEVFDYLIKKAEGVKDGECETATRDESN